MISLHSFYSQLEIETGWFGIPGGPEWRSTKVHICMRRRPVCGTRMGPNQQFQFCATGMYMPYVECKRCQKRFEDIGGIFDKVVELQEKVEELKRKIEGNDE